MLCLPGLAVAFNLSLSLSEIFVEFLSILLSSFPKSRHDKRFSKVGILSSLFISSFLIGCIVSAKPFVPLEYIVTIVSSNLSSSVKVKVLLSSS